MPVPERGHELIQKYLDGLNSESELAELERLLATDPEVAQAFAEMARLHANLQDYFRKQYKMDQVAALLNAPEPPLSTTGGEPDGQSSRPAQPDKAIEPPTPSSSTFTSRYTGPVKTRRGAVARQLNAIARKWKPIAVAALIMVTGAAIWISKNSDNQRPRLISGRVTVAGRDVSQIPDNFQFEVTGHEAAVIQLPGGARIELVAATRAAFRRDRDQFVLQLESGGGDFRVEPDQPLLRVETVLGVVTVVTAEEGHFSLDLVTKLPAQVSPTISLELPRLVVAVAQGSVRVQQGDMETTLSAGEEHIFLNHMSS